ncbi:unnamed protein product [Bursaphelenchus xylophilus]|uniref:(pine wood nematode) hypothetical protein n=1 Tax=Bursaphelenchus xylophilus TaxID=6326 RepID=A0A1I7RV39_BURXY|nr:unnamed protein product [Bursaphelenchus xylophilus]CAG9105139.1 unnamed protein product [Bursaphelenchus xylophilus]
MSEFDLSSIPIPPSSSANQPDPNNPFWAKAQEQLARLQPRAPNAPPPLPPQFHDPVYQTILSQQQQPAGYARGAMSAAGRLNSEKRIRESYQAGFVRPPPNSAVKYPNFRPAGGNANMVPLNQRMPFGSPGYIRPQQAPNVTVTSAHGQTFVYSEFFSRMVPQSVKDYCDRALAAAPDDANQVRYYLKERISPMLDSGMATRINWNAEKLPHEVKFQLNLQWTPASAVKLPGAPSSAPVSFDLGNRKRPSDGDGLPKFTPLNTENNVFDKYDADHASTSKKSKKAEKKERKRQQQQQQAASAAKAVIAQRFSAPQSRYPLIEEESTSDEKRKAARAQRFASASAQSANIRTRSENQPVLGPQGFTVQRKQNGRINLNSLVEKCSLKRRRRIIGTCTAIEKPYFRLTTEADPSQVRPYHILRRALEHVLRVYREKNDDYHYANDQLKSIRQDILTQDIRNEFAIQVYEEHALLAIKHKDREELNQAQNQLKVLYETLSSAPNRWRFTSYRLLYYAYVESESDATGLMQKYRDAFAKSPEMKLAREIYMAYATRNHCKFFGIYRKVDTVTKQLMDFFVDRERNRLMQAVIAAYRPTLSLPQLAGILMLDERSELPDYLKGIGVEIDQINGQKAVDLRKYSNLKIPNS